MLPEGPGQCAWVHCILGRVSLLLTMLIVSARRMILRKQNLFCLPKNRNNWSLLGRVRGFVSGFSKF